MSEFTSAASEFRMKCVLQRSLLTRSPGRCGISAGAITRHSIPSAPGRRCSAKPPGPASEHGGPRPNGVVGAECNPAAVRQGAVVPPSAVQCSGRSPGCARRRVAVGAGCSGPIAPDDERRDGRDAAGEQLDKDPIHEAGGSHDRRAVRTLVQRVDGPSLLPRSPPLAVVTGFPAIQPLGSLRSF